MANDPTKVTAKSVKADTRDIYAAGRSSAQTLTTPNTANARKAVLLMGVLLFAYVLATPDKGTSFRRVISSGYVFLMLSLLADFAPQVAGPMSVLIVLGLIITPQGQAALNKLPVGNTVITKPAAPQNRSNAAQ